MGMGMVQEGENWMYIIWFGHAALRQDLSGSLGCDVNVDESEQGSRSPVSRTCMGGPFEVR